jgi:hypothetical protein
MLKKKRPILAARGGGSGQMTINDQKPRINNQRQTIDEQQQTKTKGTLTTKDR